MAASLKLADVFQKVVQQEHVRLPPGGKVTHEKISPQRVIKAKMVCTTSKGVRGKIRYRK